MHGKKKWAKRVKTFPQWSETPGSIWFHNVLFSFRVDSRFRAVGFEGSQVSFGPLVP